MKKTYPLKSKQTTLTAAFVSNVSIVTNSAPDAWQPALASAKFKGDPLTVYSLFGPPTPIDGGVSVIREDVGFIRDVVGLTALVVVGVTSMVVVGVTSFVVVGVTSIVVVGVTSMVVVGVIALVVVGIT